MIPALDVLSPEGRRDILFVADDERVRCAFIEDRCLYLGATDAKGVGRILAYRQERARMNDRVIQ